MREERVRFFSEGVQIEALVRRPDNPPLHAKGYPVIVHGPGFVGLAEMAAAVLEALGETPAAAREAVRRFRQADEATLEAQYQVKDDAEKFLATSREAAQQLEKLFDADRPPAQ